MAALRNSHRARERLWFRDARRAQGSGKALAYAPELGDALAEEHRLQAGQATLAHSPLAVGTDARPSAAVRDAAEREFDP